MTEKQDLLFLIADWISDYREGEIPEPNSEHVERWVSQFDKNVQFSILREMEHVVSKVYLSKGHAASCFDYICGNEELVGHSPKDFWKKANFLNIQGGGASQKELLSLFNILLEDECGFGIDQCGTCGVTHSGIPQIFVYIDDAVFSGNRVRRDLESWIANDAPDNSQLHIIVIAVHTGAYYFVDKCLHEAVITSRKKISINWWYEFAFEDRKARTNVSDVLRPVKIPLDSAVVEYVKAMRYKPHLRDAGHAGGQGVFSSDLGRQILEQEFLKAGVHIRQICPYLGEAKRPLGHSSLETLGFGSLFVTFRNCPNNTPLALWAGAPWYPLFPRKTNTETSLHRSTAKFEEYDF